MILNRFIPLLQPLSSTYYGLLAPDPETCCPKAKSDSEKSPADAQQYSSPTLLADFMDQIQAGNLFNDVFFLAADAMFGRKAGGQILENEVTEYIEKRFRQMAIKPLFKDGQSYRQPFMVDWVPPHKSVKDHLQSPKSFRQHPLGPEVFSPDDVDRLVSDLALRTHNLAGVLEGTDPELKSEYIVICAHMDHAGTNPLAAPGEDFIYNGADDNASSVAAVLEILRVLARAKAKGHGSKRSLLVLFSSAEEMGLLGSGYFVENLPVPAEKIKGLINLEMLGQFDPKQIWVLDRDRDGTDFFFHRQHPAQDTGITRVEHDLEFGRERSDHANFAKLGIPFILIAGSVNPPELRKDPKGRDILPENYHRLDDEPEHINPQKLLNCTRFVYQQTISALNHAIDSTESKDQSELKANE